MNLYFTTLCCLFFIVLSGFSSPLYAQDNNKLAKANTLFKAKRYAEAIIVYEDILEKNFNKSVLLKLGRCHRQVNNLPEALEHYTTLMAQPEVKPDIQLEYVELLIMNGDYQQATQYVSKIPSTNTNFKQILNLTSMINNNYEIDTMFHNVQLTSFAHNTPLNDENSPFFLQEKLILQVTMLRRGLQYK